MKKTTFLLFALVAGVFLFGCGTNNKQESITGAQQIGSTQIESVPKNSRGLTVEQEQIAKRVHRTTDPTKILWMHIISLDGKMILRTPVVSKVTSSTKRLQPVHAVNANEAGYPDAGFGGFETDELIGPDGVYGPSDDYIFWFDPQDRYHQLGRNYLLTDYPIDLNNPVDEMTGMYNLQKLAYEWQKQQEQILKQKNN